MLGEGGSALSKLEAAIRRYQADESREIDLKGLRQVIDELKAKLAQVEAIQGASPDRPATNPKDPA
jgi:hypothetical protein